jgi:hypothetical protein
LQQLWPSTARFCRDNSILALTAGGRFGTEHIRFFAEGEMAGGTERMANLIDLGALSGSH